MDWNTYVKESARTSAKLETPLLDNLHYTIGMVTEVGELIDTQKKNMAYNKPIDWINVQEEIGDLCWYLANFCRVNGFDLEQILANNIKKLQTRYPDKFTSEHAINRNLENERKILDELGF